MKRVICAVIYGALFGGLYALLGLLIPSPITSVSIGFAAGWGYLSGWRAGVEHG